MGKEYFDNSDDNTDIAISWKVLSDTMNDDEKLINIIKKQGDRIVLVDGKTGKTINLLDIYNAKGLNGIKDLISSQLKNKEADVCSVISSKKIAEIVIKNMHIFNKGRKSLTLDILLDSLTDPEDKVVFKMLFATINTNSGNKFAVNNLKNVIKIISFELKKSLLDSNTITINELLIVLENFVMIFLKDVSDIENFLQNMLEDIPKNKEIQESMNNFVFGNLMFSYWLLVIGNTVDYNFPNIMTMDLFPMLLSILESSKDSNDRRLGVKNDLHEVMRSGGNILKEIEKNYKGFNSLSSEDLVSLGCNIIIKAFKDRPTLDINFYIQNFMDIGDEIKNGDIINDTIQELMSDCDVSCQRFEFVKADEIADTEDWSINDDTESNTVTKSLKELLEEN